MLLVYFNILDYVGVKVHVCMGCRCWGGDGDRVEGGGMGGIPQCSVWVSGLMHKAHVAKLLHITHIAEDRQ